jgi:hypothetical protein
MTTDTLSDKAYQQQLDSTELAARIFISRLRRHIEKDGCEHCRDVLSSDLGNKNVAEQPYPAHELQRNT